MSAILEVRDLVKHYPAPGGGRFRSAAGPVRAVDGVSFCIAPGETLGLVGESGSGKSTVGRAVLGLERPTAGQILFGGEDLATLPAAALRRLRRRFQGVFQDPGGSLNPRRRVAEAIREGLDIHQIGTAADRRTRVDQLLADVGIDPRLGPRFPHELSGGQRQRVALARALALDPELLVCDEPVSSLDVSIQAQIINLMLDLRERRGIASLFIAHDLAVVRHVSHRIAVMYFGSVVEIGPAEAVIAHPAHPYTVALRAAVPRPEPPVSVPPPTSLAGEPPSPTVALPGCPFAARCQHPARDARCLSERPLLRPLRAQVVACHHAE